MKKSLLDFTREITERIDKRLCQCLLRAWALANITIQNAAENDAPDDSDDDMARETGWSESTYGCR